MSDAKVKRMALIRQKDMSLQILDKDRFDAMEVIVSNLLEKIDGYDFTPDISWRAHVTYLKSVLSDSIIYLDNIK